MRVSFVACAVALSAAPAAEAQTAGHGQHMPGMTMAKPAKPPRKPVARPVRRAAPKSAVRRNPVSAPAVRSADRAAATDAACPPEHAAMGHCTPAASAPAVAPAPASDPACPPEHAAMGHCKPAAPPPAGASAAGTALPPGDAPAPAAPPATYADRIWGAEAMARSRETLRREHGAMIFSQVMLNIAEAKVRGGGDGYRWDGEAWYGGDIHRLTIKTEGEGDLGGAAGGEVQALYSRAVGPYFNLQAGLRQDFAPGADRSYASVGVEGLAPYWFDVEATAFVSTKGDVLARLEGYYDQRITQRLILQPRIELNLSAQDVPASRIGSGVTVAEAGLRLRYEIARELAPYVGVSWERRFGDTARIARANGERTGGVSAVAGIRAWF